MLSIRSAFVAFGVLFAAIFSWLLLSDWLDAAMLNLLNEPTLVENEISARGAVGDYFNVKFGLPAAIIGALAGVVVTYIAGLLAHRQGDVEVLRFVEDSITPALKIQTQLAQKLDQMLSISRSIWELIHKFGEIREDADSEDKSNKIEEIKTDVDAELSDLNELTNSISTLFENGKQNIYSATILQRQQADLSERVSPMDLIRKILPVNSFLTRNNILNADIDNTGSRLARYSSKTSFEEALRTYMQLPNKDTDIEFLGYLLFRWYLKPTKKLLHKGVEIQVYALNIGAVFLMSIYGLLPSKRVTLSVFKDIFGGRSDIAEKMLNVTGPDRDFVASIKLREAMKEQFDDFNHLITVKTVDKNDSAQWSYYDYNKHGRLPKPEEVYEP